MPILMTAEAEGLNAAIYTQMLTLLRDALAQAPGLILHTAHATDTGFRVVELWQSKAQSDAFFARHVAPNLPPGIRPKRRTQELESLVLPQDERYLPAGNRSSIVSG